MNGLVKDMLIIDNWLAWKIGNGNKVLLGVYPKVGGAICYNFLDNLIERLRGGMWERIILDPKKHTLLTYEWGLGKKPTTKSSDTLYI